MTPAKQNALLEALALICLFCFFCSPGAAAQQTPPSAEGLNTVAVQAYRAKDYGQFLELEKHALALEPDNARYLYNVACGQALQGHAQEAVRSLNQLLARKLELGAENDTDFSGIRDTAAWREFELRVAELRKPVVSSHLAFTLSDKNLIATGVAFDPQTGDVYIASARERKIVRRSKNGAVSDFIQQGQDGFLGGASLAIDSSHHLLFASTAAAPFMLGYKKEVGGQSGVFAFDLKSGKLSRKAMLPADGKDHFLNALAVAKNGDVYVSDSLASGIYRLPEGKQELEVFVPTSIFRATQGLAFSDDERTLYVADYLDGLWAFDMASKTRRRIAAPAGAWLAGLDGLSRGKGGFISVQIGVNPERVLHLLLDDRGEKLTGVDILEMGHPDYSGPIQGVVAGHDFLYVANSQLNLPNPQTGDFPAERARPTIVLRLPLP